jgi:hypothetical protein
MDDALNVAGQELKSRIGLQKGCGDYSRKVSVNISERNK